ncbi:hypothetical protein AB0I82_12530 [Streptomyces sp. NPDC050315]|uniref:hypothetical protein n=1 Tax=Streptomyces sp. NPDC050315 TaxID=3155039 RepID=UPI00341E7BDB
MPEREGFMQRIADNVRDVFDDENDGAKAPGKKAPQQRQEGNVPQPAPQGPPPGPAKGRPDPEVAKVVYLVGKELTASDKAMLAAFEAALVESGMENLNYGDRDSVGVFQQRPSQDWGTPAQCMNVNYAAHKFFERAVVADRDNPDFTAGQLAQKVQVSAYPERYDQREGEARQLIETTREALNEAAPPPPGPPPLPPAPEQPRQDVLFDMKLRDELFAGLQLYMVTNGHDFALPGWVPDPFGRRRSEASLEKVLALDPLITSLSHRYRMRKALIQAPVFWEYRADGADWIADGMVMSYYHYKEWQEHPSGREPTVPYPKDDASTGIAQIFSRTSIRARNFAHSKGLLPDPKLDENDWHDVWAEWQRLHHFENHNVGTVPLVHLKSAEDLNIRRPEPLLYNEADIWNILARYNGTNLDAVEYGRRALDLYKIFEAFNARLRG